MKKVVLILTMILTLCCLTGCGNNKTLSCKFEKEYDDYTISVEHNFTFENEEIISYENNNYMKFDSTTKRDNMYNQLDAMSSYFENVDGLSFKLNINENNELKQSVKIDDVSVIPTIFESFVSELGGIDKNSTKEEIKTTLEKDDYICK